MTPRFAVGDRVVIKQGFAVGMTGVVHYVGETEGDLLYMVDYDELVEHEGHNLAGGFYYEDWLEEHADD